MQEIILLSPSWERKDFLSSVIYRTGEVKEAAEVSKCKSRLQSCFIQQRLTIVIYCSPWAHISHTRSPSAKLNEDWLCVEGTEHTQSILLIDCPKQRAGRKAVHAARHMCRKPFLERIALFFIRLLFSMEVTAALRPKNMKTRVLFLTV